MVFLWVEIDMAIKYSDGDGGWKENSHIFKTPKACSSVKMFFGDYLIRIMDSLPRIYNTTCLLPLVLKKYINKNVYRHYNIPTAHFMLIILFPIAHIIIHNITCV